MAVGAFPLLTAEIAHQLEQAKSPGDRLLVLIRPGSSDLLDARARAVLFAALRTVDAVAIDNGEILPALNDTGTARVVEFRRYEAAALQDIQDRVLRFQDSDR